MKKVDGRTQDIIKSNIEKLKIIFPDVFDNFVHLTNFSQSFMKNISELYQYISLNPLGRTFDFFKYNSWSTGAGYYYCKQIKYMI